MISAVELVKCDLFRLHRAPTGPGRLLVLRRGRINIDELISLRQSQRMTKYHREKDIQKCKIACVRRAKAHKAPDPPEGADKENGYFPPSEDRVDLWYVSLFYYKSCRR